MIRASLLLVLLAACDTTPPTVKVTTSAVVNAQAERTLVIFVEDGFVDRADAIASGERPKGFHWIALGIPQPLVDRVFEDGLRVDLATEVFPFEFAQSYRDVCNPALDDYSPCWLSERYTARESGLQGKIDLRLDDERATVSIDISWEGDTDRFGKPIQWHRHSTTAGAVAHVVNSENGADQ